jgi:hypothetical protein
MVHLPALTEFTAIMHESGTAGDALPTKVASVGMQICVNEPLFSNFSDVLGA